VSKPGATPRSTLRQVASHAGVHPATVSRALNPETRQLVNADTLRRVLAAVRDLDYRTNEIARSLRTHRSFTVGVVIPDITNPLFPRLVRGLEDGLDAVGYTSLVAYTDDLPEREEERIRRLQQRGVDGFILATARHKDPTLEALAAEGVAVVLINRRTASDAIPSVTVDDRGGTRDAVRHLIELGHRRIAHVGAPSRLSTARARLEGFRAAMREAGLKTDAGAMTPANAVTQAEGQRLGRLALQRDPALTAIVAANDLMALGCYDAIAEAGLRCPGDVSVIGFNDMPFADRFDPPLTTVRFDHYGMGHAAAGMLVRRLRTEEATPSASHLRLETKLVIRSSTGPAPPRRG
jgi:LacI family transcriptional regulator